MTDPPLVGFVVWNLIKHIIKFITNIPNVNHSELDLGIHGWVDSCNCITKICCSINRMFVTSTPNTVFLTTVLEVLTSLPQFYVMSPTNIEA